jgi:predicted ATPase
VPDNETTGVIDARFRPERTADVLIDLISRIHDEPFAALAEDGQWLDAASTNLMRRLGEAAATRPWTVIVTARSGGEEYEVLGNEVALKPLDDNSIRAIANEVTAGAPLRPHELDSVVMRAGGNPLFLSEILNVIRETGSAETSGDSQCRGVD